MRNTDPKVALPIVGVFALLAVVEFLYFPGRSLDAHVRALQAKAVALGELAAHSAGPALEFEDESLIDEVLSGVARDQQLEYAAVFKGDRTLLRSVNKAGFDLARLQVAPGRKVTIDKQHIQVVTPIDVSIGDSGVLITGFSTRDIIARSRADQQVAGSIALAIFGLGMFMAVWIGRVLRNVARLNAQLSNEAINLDRKVQERTRELDERNRGTRLVLDNVAQGLITVGIDGVMSAERSAVVDRWFGAPEPGAKLGDYLALHSPSFAQWLDIGLDQLRDGFMPAELVIDQLPKRFVASARTFDVSYTPIGRDGSIDRLLVILNDATDQLARERAETEQKELVAFFQRIWVDRTGVEEFLTEAAALLGALREEKDPVIQKRLVHTLKGNSAMYGLNSFAELAHDIESEMAATGGPLTSQQCATLVSFWKQAMLRVGWLLGGASREVVEVDRRELDALITRARAGTSSLELSRELTHWTRHAVEPRLERLGRQACALARRIGKPEPTIQIDGGGVRLDGAGWPAFWSAMVHIVRNSVDHGLEDADKRARAGKAGAGVLRLAALRDRGEVTISVSDDGAGVDWEKVRHKAQAKGLPYKNHADLVNALFHDGLSTRDAADDLSGRGVGLGALRQAVHNLGGYIEVDSTIGQGTTFRMVFDEQRAVTAIVPVAPAQYFSLLPVRS